MTRSVDYFVYILECADGTLYTGITNDLEKRIGTHNSGKGAKYTRGRLPVRLVYFEKVAERGEATRREMEIKSLSKSGKERLISGYRVRMI